jgi:hypothetical protein
MVQCLSAFLNCYYIVRRNAITTSDITAFQCYLADFHRLRQIFITTGVRKDFSLPRQHALMHYPNAIEQFGSPNGTCTSQTEAKHIGAVKEPWRRSNHNQPLPQMILTITRLDKLTALQRVFRQRGMLVGSITNYMAQQFVGKLPPILPWSGASVISAQGDISDSDHEDDSDDHNNVEPVSGPRTKTNIWLASRHRTF